MPFKIFRFHNMKRHNNKTYMFSYIPFISIHMCKHILINQNTNSSKHGQSS
ncbi:hypothetical protein Hanom_Chr06g00549931 [Helianthus anomalus]